MIFLRIIICCILLINCTSKSYKENLSDNSSEIVTNVKDDKSEETYTVYKVIDGDTFYCYDSNKNELKIRLIGIDTPETRNRFKKKKGYYGEEAKVYLTNLILDKQVKLKFDLDKYDRYNRILAYAYTIDNLFINAELVKNGFARIMTIQPNSKYAELFYKVQQEARENKIGLWAVEDY